MAGHQGTDEVKIRVVQGLKRLLGIIPFVEDQRGLAIPIGERSLAGGMNSAIDGRQQEILSDRQTLVAFGDMPVQEFHESDLLGEIKQRDDVGKSGNIDGLGPLLLVPSEKNPGFGDL